MITKAPPIVEATAPPRRVYYTAPLHFSRSRRYQPNPFAGKNRAQRARLAAGFAAMNA